jgi:hypothetical protein
LAIKALPKHWDYPAERDEGEQTVALRLYATTNLENATVTGDACMREDKSRSK